MLNCFVAHGCDRGYKHRYNRIYEPIFSPLRDEPLQILEVGIYKGAGIAAWLDYFPNASVFGIDTFQRIKPAQVPVLAHQRVGWCKGDSTTINLEGEFDLIFDDGDHAASTQLATFKNLYPQLKKGGVYFIEDVFPVDELSAAELKNHGKWVSPLADYHALLAGLPSYELRNLRAISAPDSCLLEITK